MEVGVTIIESFRKALSTIAFPSNPFQTQPKLPLKTSDTMSSYQQGPHPFSFYNFLCSFVAWMLTPARWLYDYFTKKKDVNAEDPKELPKTAHLQQTEPPVVQIEPPVVFTNRFKKYFSENSFESDLFQGFITQALKNALTGRNEEMKSLIQEFHAYVIETPQKQEFLISCFETSTILLIPQSSPKDGQAILEASASFLDMTKKAAKKNISQKYQSTNAKILPNSSTSIPLIDWGSNQTVDKLYPLLLSSLSNEQDFDRRIEEYVLYLQSRAFLIFLSIDAAIFELIHIQNESLSICAHLLLKNLTEKTDKLVSKLIRLPFQMLSLSNAEVESTSSLTKSPNKKPPNVASFKKWAKKSNLSDFFEEKNRQALTSAILNSIANAHDNKELQAFYDFLYVFFANKLSEVTLGKFVQTMDKIRQSASPEQKAMIDRILTRHLQKLISEQKESFKSPREISPRQFMFLPDFSLMACMDGVFSNAASTKDAGANQRALIDKISELVLEAIPKENGIEEFFFNLEACPRGLNEDQRKRFIIVLNIALLQTFKKITLEEKQQCIKEIIDFSIEWNIFTISRWIAEGKFNSLTQPVATASARG